MQAGIGVCHDDGGMVDAEKHPVRVQPPFGVTLAGGEMQNLEVVPIRIAEVERGDAARRRVPRGQQLWSARGKGDLEFAQMCERAIHVGDDDRNMLVVSARRIFGPAMRARGDP